MAKSAKNWGPVIVWLVLGLVVAAAAQMLSGPALVKSLQGGGYVIVTENRDKRWVRRSCGVQGKT